MQKNMENYGKTNREQDSNEQVIIVTENHS